MAHEEFLLLVMAVVLVVGCGKTEPELTPEQKALRDSVVGEYEDKYKNGDTFKWAFLENGVFEAYKNGNKLSESKWSMCHQTRSLHAGFAKAGEIHVDDDSGRIKVFRINTDKSITTYAYINTIKFKDGVLLDYITGPTTRKKIK